MKAYQRYSREGVVFLGMATSYNSSPLACQDFLDRNGIEWPNLYGADESISAFEVSAFPTKFVIGRDGIIRWNSIRDGRRMELEDAIESALAE